MNTMDKRKYPFYEGFGEPFRADKIARNEKCRCGSGLKAKRCCGSDTRYFVKKKIDNQKTQNHGPNIAGQSN